MKTTNKLVSREELENILVECVLAYSVMHLDKDPQALIKAMTVTLDKEFPIPHDETLILL